LSLARRILDGEIVNLRKDAASPHSPRAPYTVSFYISVKPQLIAAFNRKPSERIRRALRYAMHWDYRLNAWHADVVPTFEVKLSHKILPVLIADGWKRV
jgi:hypothetical protein